MESDDGLYLGTKNEVNVFFHTGNYSSQYFDYNKYTLEYVGSFCPSAYEGNYQISGGVLVRWCGEE